MAGALSGLRVIDMSRYIAGPFCGQLLGDLGADVVKVERIDGGEEGRRVGEAIAGDTFFFLSANRNKRGLAVDFRDPESQALLADLADLLTGSVIDEDLVFHHVRGVDQAFAVDRQSAWHRLDGKRGEKVPVRIKALHSA